MSPPIEIHAIPPAAPVPAVGHAVGNVATQQRETPSQHQATSPSERRAAKEAPVKADTAMVHLGYTVDHAANSLKIKVTNQDSGEVVREFELKGLGAAHHEPTNTKGLVIDDKT